MGIFFKKHNRIKVGGSNSINCYKELLHGAICGENNNINFVNQRKETLGRININITGNNNLIIIENIENRGDLNINIVGCNNKITLNNGIIVVKKLRIYILEKCQNGSISVGEKTTFWNTLLQTCDNDSSIEIGEDCMFSFDTRVFNTDGHCVMQDGNLINKAESLKIGNHVWAGYESVILKNSRIADNTIIGYKSLVLGNHCESNVVLAGIPAKIVKRNIDWNRQTPNEYENNMETIL